MNKLQKILSGKRTENGDEAYTTTGDNLTDLIFMTPFFERHLDQAKIGDSEKEKVFSMFVRDPRHGMGRRDLGRHLMGQAKLTPKQIAVAGRFDDLYFIPTDENIAFLYEEVKKGNELAKKWCPRLTGRDKKLAKALCSIWGITQQEYRQLIKTDSTVEYKLSYAERQEGTPLNELFKEGTYSHPLVKDIDFEKVPSLAMTKYLHLFSTREDLKDRFSEYMEAVKQNKAKVNVTTTNIATAKKVVSGDWIPQSVSEEEARDIVAKKVVEKETLNVNMNAIPILDTSASMTWGRLEGQKPIDVATSIAHAIAIGSTYAKNQVVSFSSSPMLMTIKGDTLKEQYESLYTGDCSNTDFGAVMDLLKGLKTYPEYLVVISDMEFDVGSSKSKESTMKMFKERGAKTKIIWWNLDARNKTVPEFDEYGNIYLSGYSIQLLRLLENKFDMKEYIDKILEKYKKDVDFYNI